TMPSTGTVDLGEIAVAPSEGAGAVAGELKISGGASDAHIMLGAKGGGFRDFDAHVTVKKNPRFEFTDIPDGSYELRIEGAMVRIPVKVRGGQSVDVGAVEV